MIFKTVLGLLLLLLLPLAAAAAENARLSASISMNEWIRYLYLLHVSGTRACFDFSCLLVLSTSVPQVVFSTCLLVYLSVYLFYSFVYLSTCFIYLCSCFFICLVVLFSCLIVLSHLERRNHTF